MILTEQMFYYDFIPLFIGSVGITGWAQINGRNAISWEDKFQLDVWCVENQSLSLDMKILLMTVLKVLKRDWHSAADGTTMLRLTGERD